VTALGALGGSAVPILASVVGLSPASPGLGLAAGGFVAVVGLTLGIVSAVGGALLAMGWWFPDEPDVMDDIASWRWSPFAVLRLPEVFVRAPRSALLVVMGGLSAFAGFGLASIPLL